MSWGTKNHCNSAFCFTVLSHLGLVTHAISLGLRWDAETCPCQGQELQLENELEDRNHEDCRCIGLRQLPQALCWIARCSSSCLIRPKSGVSAVIWDRWTVQKNLKAILKSPDKSPWEVLFPPAVNNEIYASRNMLLLPQFRTSSPLPEHGSCTENERERSQINPESLPRKIKWCHDVEPIPHVPLSRCSSSTFLPTHLGRSENNRRN